MAAVAMYDSRQNPGKSSGHDAASALGPGRDYNNSTAAQDLDQDPASASHESHDESPNGQHASDESQGEAEGKGRSAKRRKLSKDAEKKFNCPHAGCDKKYSRAEHLYRHQLNHNPKQIYICDHPGCDRRFVRQDLCTRHKERHNSRESGVVRTTKSRYDLAVTYQNPHPGGARGSKSGESRRDSTIGTQMREGHAIPGSSNGGHPHEMVMNVHNPESGSVSPVSIRRHSMHVQENRPHLKHDSSSSNGHHMSSIPQYSPVDRSARPSMSAETPSGYAVNQTQQYPGTYPVSAQSMQNQASSYNMQPYTGFVSYGQPSPQRRNSASFSSNYQQQAPQGVHFMSPTVQNVTTQQTMPGMTPYAPHFQSPAQLSMHQGQQAMGRDMAIASPINEGMYQQPMAQYPQMVPGFVNTFGDPSIPVFNNEIYNNAPFASADDFTQWLFDNETSFNASMIPPDMLGDDFASQRQTPQDFTQRMDTMRSSGENSGEPTPSLASSTAPHRHGPPRAFESVIHAERRKALLDFVIETFHDRNHTLVTEYRKMVLSGDRERYPHVLSLPMLETYLSSFWNNVHPQLPILHRPTFATESCPDYLLLTMLALGASNLDRSHGFETRTRSSDFSFFLAWHIRYRLFQDPDFGPPAKLWIFQAMLLLEIFEKMYSSRSLHERSHIHHSTTITLMRRGSSLIGRYAQDFPPFTHTDSTGSTSSSLPATNPIDTNPIPQSQSVNASGFNTQDAEWNAWISNEATRRIAFAAFIIDTTHAHMFGHSAVMVAHEMRIALPCDEAMWAADSMAEVASIRARLDAQEYRQVSFLEALKRTLNCQPVKTNTFGRVSIMAGLLSVSWHMKMQDVRVSSVGIGQAGAWGGKLLRAFDFWKKDFDESLKLLSSSSAVHRAVSMGMNLHAGLGARVELDRDNVFEARTVLHHLAHMAMHCDVLDCMMYAGATRLLGRVITPQDRTAAKRRMVETWAPSARARDSTFYALRFLSSALMVEDGGEGFGYTARNDVLLNRPWVLYLAGMVVWSYGFAREGPLKDPEVIRHLGTREAQVRDMNAFLLRVGGGDSPAQLEKMEGKNRVLGLFMLLRGTFLQARWELLHEAADLMGRCISMLVPGQVWEGMHEKATGR
ncbi:Fungal specific transcription factor domain-containing protein 35 [Elsinoe fawcettii]|nr:Fungal specific transcription factor domain-containing protein 35 [Elsinoe fawcettii]